ncbi:hypothetical protein DI09_101p40 [Mitosporidium daphniae]|uniref:Uncharacterized protein n=1 Tax=Mitosporidium daphniae TaxID=1485682 RepID=A0A098VWG8_9MICR|nr:uncharacterized protein DI09_101p40 [Mitosporidium daphniae]KGG53229.1 hypothetical protein DI09_101p40 [Mitosporidium daphniae]|eukprot:XP_013239665.1 uncharacterized protein DI09_101p40 [Mitosporidium daphniae]
MDVPLPRAASRDLTSFLIFHISMLLSESSMQALEDELLEEAPVELDGPPRMDDDITAHKKFLQNFCKKSKLKH